MSICLWFNRFSFVAYFVLHTKCVRWGKVFVNNFFVLVYEFLCVFFCLFVCLFVNNFEQNVPCHFNLSVTMVRFSMWLARRQKYNLITTGNYKITIKRLTTTNEKKPIVCFPFSFSSLCHSPLSFTFFHYQFRIKINRITNHLPCGHAFSSSSFVSID